jgi:hypothetical protein
VVKIKVSVNMKDFKEAMKGELVPGEDNKTYLSHGITITDIDFIKDESQEYITFEDKGGNKHNSGKWV